MRLFHLATLLLLAFLSADARCAEPQSETFATITITTATRQAFANEQFSELNEVARRYRMDRSRMPSGRWRLGFFYAGIGEEVEAQRLVKGRDAAFAGLKARFAKWTRKHPNQAAAHIAYSTFLIDHAWEYRGGGYAYEVDPQKWAPFLQFIAEARTNLERHKTVASHDPQWYVTMLTIARAEGWDRDRFDRLLAEALDREPLYYPTYFAALEYLLPKWQGDLVQIEALAENAVKRTSALEGETLYARIYWFASQTQFEDGLFADSFVHWPRMKVGFDDLIARYPDLWNLNNYAKFACLANDTQQAGVLLKRIGSGVIRDAWTSPLPRERCMGLLDLTGQGVHPSTLSVTK